VTSDAAFALRSVEAFVFRCPVDTPVRTSFGTMHDRPGVLVRVTDGDGASGWGEAWCNFPAVGAEHRARLVRGVLAPLAEGRSFRSPQALFAHLSERTAVLAIQSGEPGPIAQAIAGVDIAVWDMVARRQSLPLWRLLGGQAGNVEVYASGLNPDAPERLAAARRDEGHRRFKLKVGFGRERDLRNLAALREALGPSATLMVDANQAWELDEAEAMLPALRPFDLQWLEEPLRADRPWAQWLRLRERSAIPLACGENIAGDAAFASALAAGALSVVQPDIAKWGGISAGLPVARAILAAGRRFCPHYLGGGVGLLASAHLLAAAGGDGWLEIDANPNPLRERLCGPLAEVRDGRASLGQAPGLGVEPAPAALADWRRDF
jgi:L-alanine-DL-glutamate epimerase-like enolase superfamily enzyme